ncbi:MAG: hypothetical protein GF350_16000 [Chitinivibrionales bacterium]|nr:hypothetical protein [Chitinivibrionales bacterium]
MYVPLAGNCSQRAGDPYGQRAIALQAGINQFSNSKASEQSTAGYIAFSGSIISGHEFEPVVLNEAGKIAFDSQIDVLEQEIDDLNFRSGTDYAEALDKAISWFNDETLTPNSKQAIVFISDGRPTQQEERLPDLQNSLLAADIPVYGIFLGTGSAGSALEDLSTSQRYYTIDPDSSRKLAVVVDSIITEISQGFAAQTVSVQNVSTGQSSASSDSIEAISETEFRIFLDSTIELDKGSNQVAINANFSSPAQGVDDTTISFNVTINVEGDPDPDCITYYCYPESRLEILNDSLTQQNTSYTIRLTTYDTSLSVAYFTVSTTNEGDREADVRFTSRVEETDNTGTTYLVFEGTYQFRSSNSGTSAPNNGTVEARLTDTLFAEWENTRASRDTATARKNVKSLPNGFSIDSVSSSTSPYADFGTVTTWQAGDSMPLVGKIFADNEILQEYQSSPLNEYIRWEFRDTVTGNLNDSSIGFLTADSVHQLSFYPRQARKTVKIMAWLDRPDLPQELRNQTRDSILVYIGPGEPSYLVIEGTPDSSLTNLYDPGRNSEIDLIEIDPNSREDSAYAILRDKESNFIGPSTNTDWESRNPNIVTARDGDADIGEGHVEKGVEDSGQVYVLATSGTYPGLLDSVLVVSRKYTIDSLRIVNEPGQRIGELAMTTNDDTTLYVEGWRSDGLGWETVTADWSIVSQTVTTEPLPPSGSADWEFSPSDTGTGWIKVERPGAASDSIQIDFTPGFPTQLEIEIIDPAIDSIIAGQEITAVVRIRNENGPIPGLYCYPDQTGGRLVVYQDVLGPGGGTRPDPTSTVNDSTAPLNQEPDTAWRSPECFTNGIDTVSFVLYYAPSSPDSLNQLIVRLHGLEARTDEFRVYPDSVDSITMYNVSTPEPSPAGDTIRLDAGNYRLLESRLYDRFGNSIDCSTDSVVWRAQGGIPQVTDSTACRIYYKTDDVQYDAEGTVCVRSGMDTSIADCAYIIITAPDAVLVTAKTRDFDADGYLDGIVLTYDKAIDTTGFSTGNIDISYVRTSFDITQARLIEDNILLVTFAEEDTGVPQTGWTPQISITGLNGADDVNERTAADGAPPVIWKVVKEIKNIDDRSQDIVTVTFSENLSTTPGGADSPFESFIVWQDNDSSLAVVDTMLEDIDFFLVSQEDDQAKFQMKNGRNLTVDNLLSIQVGGDFKFSDNAANPQKTANNRQVYVELEGLDLRVTAGPNPFPPNANPAYLKEDETLRSYKSKTVAEFVYNFGGTAFVVDIPLPSNPDNIDYMKITGSLKIYDVVGNLVYSRDNQDNLVLEEWRTSVAWTGDKQLGFRWLGVNDKGMKVAPGAYNAILRLHIKYLDAYGVEQTENLMEQIALGVRRNNLTTDE